MKRLSLVLAVLLVVVLLLPAVAAAQEPFHLWPPEDGVPYPTVPAAAPLALDAGWIAGSRGLAMSGPTFNEFYFTVTRLGDPGATPEVVWAVAPSQSKLYWLPGVRSDSPWAEGCVAFNPRIGAQVFAKEWMCTCEGLEPGDYHIVAGVIQTRKATDLLGGYFEGQHSPVILQPGDFPMLEWDFTVAVLP